MAGFVDDLMKEITDFLKGEVSDHLEQAKADAQAFVDASKDKLKKWFEELASEQLTKSEFEFLVKSQRDLAEMNALTQIGLAKARIDRIVNGIIQTVIDAGFKAI